MSDKYNFLMTTIGVAMLGGVSGWLTSDKHTIFQFIVSIFVAGFVGLLVGQLCIQYNVSEAWTFFFCGSSGVSAEAILKLFKKITMSKIRWMVGGGPGSNAS